MKITIAAPPYRHNSAGVMALHILANELASRGCNVAAWDSDPDRWALYPEIWPDNWLNAERPVWWLLNRAEIPTPRFSWTPSLSDDPLLTVNVVNLDVFCPRQGKRSGVVVYQGKGRIDWSVVPEGARLITKGHPDTKEGLAEMLASAEWLYSFDDFSSVNLEASLLGTPVRVFGDRSRLSEIGGTGYAYSDSEMEQAFFDVRDAFDAYASLLPVFSKRIDDFVEFLSS
jgi:hypothetical protein